MGDDHIDTVISHIDIGSYLVTLPGSSPFILSSEILKVFRGSLAGRECSKHQAGGIQLTKRGLANVLEDILNIFWQVLP